MTSIGAKRLYHLFILSSVFILKNSFALDSLSYSGRLVQTNGAPVSGTVTIRAELAYTNNLSTVLCSDDIAGVVLTKGVFHVKLDFVCPGKTLTQVLSQKPANESVAIQITDMTNAKSYSFQALHAMPYANVASQLTQMGAADGDFLKWNNTNKKWEPGVVSGASGGTVTNVSGTLPVSVSNGTSTPTISISQANGTTSGYLSSADWNTFNSKEGTIAGGTAAQFYRGDKTWQTLDSSAVPENVNLYFTNARVLGVPLAGFTTAAGAIVATDTTLQAFGKAQGQINAINTAATNYLIKNSTDSVTGVVNVGTTGLLQLVYVPVGLNDATNKAYVDSEVGNKVSKAGDTMSGVLTLDNDLRIKGGSNHVTVKGHATSANYNLILPQTVGTAGYVLSTDGSGNTSWVSPSVGSSTITDGSIVDADVNATAAIAQSKIANLTTDLSNKQPLITAGTTAQYYRGDKTFVDLGTDVRATALTGFSTGANSSIIATDTTLGAFQKVQGQIDATNTSVAGKESTLTAGTTSQYYRGDKSWQTLNGSAVANTAAGTIAATDVQSALNELDTEKQDKLIATSVVSSGEVRFYELPGNGTEYVSLKAPTALAANLNYIFPSVAPTAGQVLSSDASGNMSWMTIPTAPIPTVFGRSGAVTATAGDYTASQITSSAAGNIAATTVQTALTELDSEKESLITAGTTSQYYRGDKTFVDFGTDVRGTTLTGFTVGANSTVAAGDTALAAFGKVQGQINATNTAVAGKEPAITAGTTAQYIRGDKTLSTFATDAINSVLSTFALNGTSKPTVSTSDSVVGAFGKVQKYLNDINSDYVSKSANQTINGTLAINSATGFITVPTPINPNDAVNKSYVDSFGHWSITGSDIYRSSGNVGIGTTSPSTPLHVRSDFNGNDTTPLLLQNAGSGVGTATGMFFDPNGNGITRAASVRSRQSTVGSYANLEFWTSNAAAPAEVMRITPAGYVGIGTANPQSTLDVNGNIGTGARISSSVDGANNAFWLAKGSSAEANRIGFGINADPTTGVVNSTSLRTNGINRLSIDTNGNVGVGTSTPSYYQHGGTNRVLEIHNSGTAQHSQTSVFFSTGATVADSSIGSISGAVPNSSATNKGVGLVAITTGANSTVATPTGELRFWTRGSADTNWAERMRVSETGNVGVGTAAPTAKLDVAGDIKATGGGTIGVTKVNGTFGNTSTNILNGAWTYVGDFITLPAGSWVVYYENFYDHDGTTLFAFSSYNHPFLSTNTSNSGAISQGNLNACSANYCPIKSTYQVTVASTTTLYIVHLMAGYSGSYVRVRNWGNFYALKVNN